MPQGKQAFNIGRLIALLSQKLPLETNGVTVSRYCASGLEAIRIASNNIKAGQGDAYIAAGVEFVSQFNERTEAAGAADQNEHLKGAAEGEPDVYIAMGDTAVNVAKRYDVKRADMDEYAQRSQELAVQSQESGFFDTRDRARDAARRHRGRARTTARAPRSTLEKLSAAARGVRGRRRRDRRQLVSAQRRRRGGADHVRHQGQGAGPDARARGSSPPPPPPTSPSTWAWPPSGPSARCWSAPA